MARQRVDVVAVADSERVMDRWTEDRLVDLVAGSADEEFKAQLRRELSEVAAELAGPAPTPIEATLVRTAALCWFALRTAEAQHAAYLKSNGVTIAGAEFRQRRIDHAHRRYLATLKTLATVRRLALPVLQVNLARNQINQLNAGAPPGLPAEVGSSPTV